MTVDELAERGIRVKPLVWEIVTRTGTWQAKCAFGEYSVGFDEGWWAQLEGVQYWDWDPPEDQRFYYGHYAAKAAAEGNHAARIAAQLECSRDACEGPGVTG